MTRDEVIKNIEEEYCGAFADEEIPAKIVAEKVIGLIKQIKYKDWHKVAEDGLPKKVGYYDCVEEDAYDCPFMLSYYDEEGYEEDWDYVHAWRYVPGYEEAE